MTSSLVIWDGSSGKAFRSIDKLLEWDSDMGDQKTKLS